MKGSNLKFKTHNSKLVVIRASEIGEYGYCSRAWWYRHVVKVPMPKGEGTVRLAEGTRLHAQHGRGVAASAMLRAAALGLLAVGLLAIMLALLLAR